VLGSDAHLFAPRAAYRWRDIPGNYASNDDPTAGQNPPYGAAVNFWLKAAPSAPLVFEILDSTRKVIRTFRDTAATAGLNRAYWDLRNDTTRSARMRTKPMYDEEFELSADGTRAAPDGGSMSVLMPPGHYTVKLIVGNASFTQPLEVRKDPSSAAALAEIHDQFRALVAIQRDAAATAEMLNTIESVRSQMQALKPQLASNTSAADVRSAGDALEQKFVDVESRILDLRLTGRGQDGVRWPVKLAGQLGYLASTIDDSDFAPTTQQREVAGILAKETRDVHSALQTLMSKDLANYNTMLRGKGLKTIDVTIPQIVF